jgi:hypothetical protein
MYKIKGLLKETGSEKTREREIPVEEASHECATTGRIHFRFCAYLFLTLCKSSSPGRESLIGLGHSALRKLLIGERDQNLLVENAIYLTRIGSEVIFQQEN